MHRFRSLRRAAVVPAMALGLALLVSSGAQAAPFVDVTYDLGGSSGTSTATIPLIGPVPVILTPDNFDGRQTIRYVSDSASNIVGGPVSLRSFTLSVHSVPVRSRTPTTALKLATATLRLVGLGLPAGGGSLTGGLITPGGQSMTLYVTGTTHCFALCAALGAGVTISVPTSFQPVSFLQPLPTLSTYTVGGVHYVTGTTTASFTLDPGDPSTSPYERVPTEAVTRLVGREISRVPVPEPGSFLLVGTALGSVVAAGFGRRFLRRR